MILLFGSPRSGTTWLGKIFDSHPSTLYLHEPDSCRIEGSPSMFPDATPSAADRERLSAWVREILRVRETKVVGKLPLFDKTYQSAASRQLRRGFILAAKFAERAGVRFAVPDLVRRGAEPAPRVVWKSIESCGRLGALVRVLDPCRAVHILRHPCGTIASVVRGERLGGFTSTGASEDYGILEMLLATEPARRRGLRLDDLKKATPVERLAWAWALSNEKTIDDTRESAQCMTLRYEDLCTAPGERARELFRHCGLDWNEQTAAFLQESTSREQDRFHSVYKDPTKSMNKWRDEMDADDIAAVRRVVTGGPAGALFADDRWWP